MDSLAVGVASNLFKTLAHVPEKSWAFEQNKQIMNEFCKTSIGRQKILGIAESVGLPQTFKGIEKMEEMKWLPAYGMGIIFLRRV